MLQYYLSPRSYTILCDYFILGGMFIMELLYFDNEYSILRDYFVWVMIDVEMLSYSCFCSKNNCYK